MAFSLVPQITHLETIGSTNDWLTTQANTLADMHWVQADSQTGGRGRRGRVWVSVPGNLFASVLVRQQSNDGPQQQLSFVAALALDKSLSRIVPDGRLALKWPNDVLLDGIKCSGILLEGLSDAVVIGFGVNLCGHPEATERPATSLAAAGLAVPDARSFTRQLANDFAEMRDLWQADGFAAIRQLWLARAAGLGKRIEARIGNDVIMGVFEDLDADGALRLRSDDGSSRAIHSGEVFGL